VTDELTDGSATIGREKEKWRSIAAGIAPTTSEESDAISGVVREVMRRHGWHAVLTFLPMPGEVDLGLLQSDRDLTLAITRTPSKGPLTVHALEEPLERHPFGYMQPRADASPVDPRGLEVVLVPGLLFARDGGRLGHGKGYYDKLLSSFRPRPYLIGTTVNRRLVDHLPMTERDVWMDGVATETGFREAST
jgi:5-formyltetrahydrofolate cyclo-ligase